MPDFSSATFWKTQWDFVMSAPWALIPLLLIAAFIGWRIKGALDDSEARGLRAEVGSVKAHRDSLEAQLRTTKETNDLDAGAIGTLHREINDLKVAIHKNSTEAELTRLAATVESTAKVLESQNKLVHHVLRADTGHLMVSGSSANLLTARSND